MKALRALFLAGLLAGCHAPPAEPGALAAGSSSQRAQPTFVSLNPCTDAILAEVADPDQVLALSHYSHDPRASSMGLAQARGFAVTGGTVEEVLALQPDVVVAGSFLAPSARNGLNALGMRVETFGIASSVKQSDAQIRQMAALAGHPERAEILLERIKQALEQLAPPAGNSVVPTVLWQPSGIVPGENALVSQLLKAAGFSSHSADQGLGQADYLPLEMLLAHPPSLLLVAGQERSQHHPALDNAGDGKRVKIDPALLYCGGPTIIRLSERIRQIRQDMQ